MFFGMMIQLTAKSDAPLPRNDERVVVVGDSAASSEGVIGLAVGTTYLRLTPALPLR